MGHKITSSFERTSIRNGMRLPLGYSRAVKRTSVSKPTVEQGWLRRSRATHAVGMETPRDLPVALVVLTRDQLSELVEDAIIQALDQFVASQPPVPRLLKSSKMSARLGICESQLGTLCKEGCPHVLVGDRQRRFEPEHVMLWLRARGRGWPPR